MMQNMSKWHATLWNTVQRGQTTGSANEANATQGLQMQRNAYQLSEFESMKHFGFASSEPDGSDVVYVAPGGQGSQAVIIASNHGASRPTGMQSGETKVYDAFNDSTYFQDGKITDSIAGNPVVVTQAGGVEITGTLNVTGNVVVGTGATGSFTDSRGRIVTVQDGIITNIF